MQQGTFAKLINTFLIGIFLFSTSAPQALAGEKVYFYHSDPSGTPIAMTDETGAVVWEADYMPFGVENEVTASIDNNKMFVGKEKDKETGLYYFGARYMEPKIGRFISPDPVGPVDPWTGQINQALLANPQRLNPYAYALNSPYRYVDPDGEFAVTAVLLATWAVAEFVMSAYDAYDTAGTVLSSEASLGEKGAAIGLFAVGMVAPGGMYSQADDLAKAGIKAAKKAKEASKVGKNAFSKEKQALVEMAQKDKKLGGITEGDLEAYKKLNGELKDPFPEKNVRGPEVHKKRNYKIKHGHVGPVSKIPIKD